MNPVSRRFLADAIGQEHRECESLVRRAQVQIEFAKALCAAMPERSLDWSSIIESAESLLARQNDAPLRTEDLKTLVGHAEDLLSPIAGVAKTFTIHCVAHGHIDMNWMWSWPETVATTHDTFAAMLSFMREYPEFTFSQSQASVYAAMQKYHPALFEEIRQRVKEGRWEVTAAHWVEGDKNLAHGEALARHLLYTRAYFKEHFDLEPEDVPVDWEPDTFGHANTIPSIVAKGGVKYYYCCRPGGGFDHPRTGPERSMLFWWEGPDGSRLLVNRESTWYNSYVNIGANVALPAVAFYEETGLRDWLNVFGVGNHGGGPTRDEIEWLIEANGFPCYPNVIFSRAKDWFELAERQVSPDLPVLKGELNYEFTGCYTSQSAIKKANRLGEIYCMQAEALDAMLPFLGEGGKDGEDGQDGLRKQPSPFSQSSPSSRSRLLREAWINVLFNQFHDILPGSGVAATREHALALFQETGAITGAVKRTAFSALAGGVNTASLVPKSVLSGPADRSDTNAQRLMPNASPANTPFIAGAGIGAGEDGLSLSIGASGRFRPWIVYNPTPWPRTDYVIVDLYDCDLDPEHIVARDEAGVNHPVMFIEKGHDWGHEKLTVLFYAHDVPAAGYKTYMLYEGVADTDKSLVTAGEYASFKTPFLDFSVDRFRSGIEDVRDKKTGLPVDGPGSMFGRWFAVTERPRGMTAWTLGDFLTYPDEWLTTHSFDVIGARYNVGTGKPLEGNLAYLCDSLLKLRNAESTVKLRTIIPGHAPRIDFEAEIDWREIGTREQGVPGLEVVFARAFANVESEMASVSEAAFGSVERTEITNDDQPSLNYVHLRDNASVDKLSVSFLQDSKYGHRVQGNQYTMRVVRSTYDPDHAPEVRKSRLRYAVYVHDKPATPSELTRLGMEFNQPLIPFPANMQEGSGPLSRSFAAVETPGVILTSMKRALDENGLVLRLVEYDGKDAESLVTLDPALIAGYKEATTVDLLEQPCSGKASLKGTRLTASVPAHGIVSVRLT